MGGVQGMLDKLYQYLVGARSIRHGVLPTSADTVAALAVTLTAAAAWTWPAAWTQIAASVGAVETQIIGLTLENYVMALGTQGEIAIASGAALAEVELARFQITNGDPPNFGPINIPAGTRVSARMRTSSGAADTVDIKLKTKTGM